MKSTRSCGVIIAIANKCSSFTVKKFGSHMVNMPGIGSTFNLVDLSEPAHINGQERNDAFLDSLVAF